MSGGAARYICPDCHGRPKIPSTRTEGGSSSCRHCNRTLTFNFMRDPGGNCSCRAACEEACPTCLGDGWVDVPRRDTVPITLWGRLRRSPVDAAAAARLRSLAAIYEQPLNRDQEHTFTGHALAEMLRGEG